jgi:hypothetical protein
MQTSGDFRHDKDQVESCYLRHRSRDYGQDASFATGMPVAGSVSQTKR